MELSLDFETHKKMTCENNQAKKIDVEVLQTGQMNKMFDGNHQGIACEIMQYEYVTLDEIIHKNANKENVALAILDGLEDPHNLGAILRTADATETLREVISPAIGIAALSSASSNID